ncbi:MAG: hypothetical protein VYB80_05250, partial [Actinomycetota bacterium]|nr:hypothetical protein [Actinomycetota bacterium]
CSGLCSGGIRRIQGDLIEGYRCQCREGAWFISSRETIYGCNCLIFRGLKISFHGIENIS